MKELGYSDDFSIAELAKGHFWGDKISEIYESYTTSSWEETLELAHLELNLFYDYSHLNYSGHIITTILRELDLVSRDLSIDYRGINIWNPENMRNPDSLSFFTHQDYELFEFAIPVTQFDFHTWQLFPGDILYVYPNSTSLSQQARLYLITELDVGETVYAIGLKDLGDQQFVVERLLLFDPNDQNTGHFSAVGFGNGNLELENDSQFDILRLRRLNINSDNPYYYFVRPGDTLKTIARRFFISVDVIIRKNKMINIGQLEVGQQILIPVSEK
jgi:hypothetical protein